MCGSIFINDQKWVCHLKESIMLTHGTLDAHAAVWDGVEFGH
jgi:hypothetical protein